MGDAAEKDRFDDLYRLLEDVPEGHFAEIVAGEIRVLPRPGPRHARAASRLDRRLGSEFDFDADGPGGWVILVEPDVRFGDELRAPDLAGWRLDRYREPGRGPHVIIPNWICEVLSPSTARSDRAEKLPLYATHGVEHVWLIDPDAATIEIYRRQAELWLLVATHAGDAQVRAEPFDAIELDLGALWRTPGSGPVGK
jgi:Uma2 family endonuclease